jgi:acetyltransferase
MKITGPVHKSDVGGVILDISSETELLHAFEHMKAIKGFEGVLIQPMISGIELFTGASYEPRFGHVILCGLGGIYVEALKDLASGLAPLSMIEAEHMIHSLKSINILKGMRGRDGIQIPRFAEILVSLSAMLKHAREIVELDFNPLIGTKDSIVVVDARIRIEKT